jgi:Ca2+-binding EF-hand superfamily protein
MLISESELRKGLEALGFHAPKEAAGALFDELDSDANNKLSFSEFSAWIHADSVRRRSTSSMFDGM